jgi:hypothetical protein
MLMRLLGAYCPKTVAGTIVGNPTAAMAPIPVFKNLRRETPFVWILPISDLPGEFYALKTLIPILFVLPLFVIVTDIWFNNGQKERTSQLHFWLYICGPNEL